MELVESAAETGKTVLDAAWYLALHVVAVVTSTRLPFETVNGAGLVVVSVIVTVSPGITRSVVTLMTANAG
ncbi:hypothetical protein [Paractinoplanes maris]|uniref:hypothetical protein n=1 Tax=Paractinoplanes maris TaxID=1734446 RepID=UPI00202229C7|nr:hypothetical protein [Actinoplanes maris]